MPRPSPESGPPGERSSCDLDPLVIPRVHLAAVDRPPVLALATPRPDQLAAARLAQERVKRMRSWRTRAQPQGREPRPPCCTRRASLLDAAVSRPLRIAQAQQSAAPNESNHRIDRELLYNIPELRLVLLT